MPRYDNTGKLTQPGYYNQMKMQDPETGGFKIKLKLPIMNYNMVSIFINHKVFIFSLCTKKL